MDLDDRSRENAPDIYSAMARSSDYLAIEDLEGHASTPRPTLPGGCSRAPYLEV
jgi:hypothetical protein